MNVQDFILPMGDAQRVLIGSSGKLGPVDFARGLLAIVAVNIVFSILVLVPGLGMIFGLLGLLVALASIYAWVCIFSKRFHDAGKSGWMTLAAIGAAIVISIILNLVLNPIFGVDMSSLASMQTMGAGMVFKNILSTIIVNGALGFYMFRLPSQ
ncbi:DUF805 domain-containing protein [Hyphobacterium sp. HN65]|uniref:DUF805 domain-containing protein n=1 Tax=Hyphobacterium lacteum TaxID=3116575 RepID=A0ABU7LNL9_9PROT|nr:DUF805 domain-containing protein [Hyphobacterium sp. HN65]MEE2525174.1 DUF805 domain-containing protein [Hyphobacterium sp. HN65]